MKQIYFGSFQRLIEFPINLIRTVIEIMQIHHQYFTYTLLESKVEIKRICY